MSGKHTQSCGYSGHIDEQVYNERYLYLYLLGARRGKKN